MFTHRVIVLSLFLFLSFMGNQSFASDETAKTYSPDELPSIIITYNLAFGYYHDLQCLRELGDPSHMIAKLYSEFEALSCSITHRMGFTYIAFIAQSNISGHFSGVLPGEDKTSGKIQVPYESILFVTTPIESLGNNVLVILSSVSPERTTIMKMDKRLNVTLLYDASMVKLPDGSMCSVFALRIIKPGLIRLFERDRGHCAPLGSKRTFIIDVTSGDFNISKGDSWENLELPQENK